MRDRIRTWKELVNWKGRILCLTVTYIPGQKRTFHQEGLSPELEIGAVVDEETGIVLSERWWEAHEGELKEMIINH